jgi:hypothetical protein
LLDVPPLDAPPLDTLVVAPVPEGVPPEFDEVVPPPEVVEPPLAGEPLPPELVNPAAPPLDSSELPLLSLPQPLRATGNANKKIHRA